MDYLFAQLNQVSFLRYKYRIDSFQTGDKKQVVLIKYHYLLKKEKKK